MRRATFAVTAILLLGACGSGSDILGGLGGILGSPSAEQPSDVRGTVQYVDTNARRIDLDATWINNLRDTNNRTDSVFYDDRTRVEYQGQNYNVSALERGDEVSIRGYNNSGRYYAEVITVTRDVSR